jgi:hypothetical protein
MVIPHLLAGLGEHGGEAGLGSADRKACPCRHVQAGRPQAVEGEEEWSRLQGWQSGHPERSLDSPDFDAPQHQACRRLPPPLSAHDGAAYLSPVSRLDG